MANNGNIEISCPPQFICPFTKKRLVEPIMSTMCGHHFERVALERLYENNTPVKCPVDQTPLVPSTMMLALEFRAVIKHWSEVEKVLRKEKDVVITTPTDPDWPTSPSLDSIGSLTGSTPPAVPRSVAACWDHPAANPPSPTQNQDIGDRPGLDLRKYKTRLCRSWLQNEHCAFGKNCHFAHGQTELRDSTSTPTLGIETSISTDSLTTRSPASSPSHWPTNQQIQSLPQPHPQPQPQPQPQPSQTTSRLAQMLLSQEQLSQLSKGALNQSLLNLILSETDTIR